MAIMLTLITFVSNGHSTPSIRTNDSLSTRSLVGVLRVTESYPVASKTSKIATQTEMNGTEMIGHQTNHQ
jgi:hypothetical protein